LSDIVWKTWVPSFEVLALADVVTITKTKLSSQVSLNFILGVVELLTRRRPQPSFDEALPELWVEMHLHYGYHTSIVAIPQPNSSSPPVAGSDGTPPCWWRSRRPLPKRPRSMPQALRVLSRHRRCRGTNMKAIGDNGELW